MRYQIAVLTDIGNKRKKNEDSLLVCRKKFGRKEAVLAAVADGMGGLAGGEWASRCVCACLQTWWKQQTANAEQPPEPEQLEDVLGFVLENAHMMIQQEIKQRNIKMGTTVTVSYLWNNKFVIFQVGDSRAYLIDKEMYQLTSDQTWCQGEVDAGRMTPEQAQVHNKRHVLSNALGADTSFYIGRTSGVLDKKQRLLLCTDGYYSYLKPEELKRKLFSGTVEKVLLSSGKRIKQGRAEDNFTAILIEAE